MPISSPSSPSSPTATRQTCRVVITAPGALSGLGMHDGVALSEGDRVLVAADPAAASNGPWRAGAGPWVRTTDYTTGTTVDPNVSIAVSEGSGGNADSRWQVVTDGTIIVDTTPTLWSTYNDTTVPDPHAPSHVNGVDDIRDATNALKGLATAAQITALEAAAAGEFSTLEVGADFSSGPYPISLSLTVDEEGNLRTDGFVLTRDAVRGVVLKNPAGNHFGVTIDGGGSLVVTPLGGIEP